MDALKQLSRTLHATFATFGGEVEVEALESRSWASVTFSGARHTLRLGLSGGGASEAADRFLSGLTEAEFELKGHIVADMALVSDRRDDGGRVLLTLEALTVEDC